VEKKSNHRVNIVRLGEPRVHTNADSLELFDVGGYQCVTKKGEFKPGDLAVYIQPDSVVPQTEPFRFIWEGHKGLDGTVPEKRRRITVRRFRKEWSEGLLMPITILPQNDRCIGWDYPEGQDVSDILGITHYDLELSDGSVEQTEAAMARAPRRKYPKSLKGWFYYILYRLGFVSRNVCRAMALDVQLPVPIFDVEAMKNYMHAFEVGEDVTGTEKIHGSNGRYLFYEGKFYAGSHYQWKAEGEGIWWKVAEAFPWIKEWCMAHPGYALYGEVVPTQKGFNYGCKEGEVKFFSYAIHSPEGNWFVPWNSIWKVTIPTENQPPILYQGPFDYTLLKTVAEGPSLVPGAKHVREGVVVTPTWEREVFHLGRLILKLVSMAFLEKDTKE